MKKTSVKTAEQAKKNVKENHVKAEERANENRPTREALISNIQWSIERLTDYELERVVGYIGRLW